MWSRSKRSRTRNLIRSISRDIARVQAVIPIMLVLECLVYELFAVVLLRCSEETRRARILAFLMGRV